MNTNSNAASAAEATETPDVHIYILLDRSGSMQSIASDVVGGFNHFVKEQQEDGSDSVITVVQFDSGDPQEVIADAVPIADMVPLTSHSFTPRGSTPLLDATGQLMARATARVAQRTGAGLPAEEILFVSITDGHENCSREQTLASIKQLVDAHSAAGWTFVFLSAALDVYGEASSMGMDQRSTQSWAADSEGTGSAFHSLSASTRSHRRKVRSSEFFDKGDFFEGDKPAEEDRTDRE
jgi:Mg-chelatase subunit ChlD